MGDYDQYEAVLHHIAEPQRPSDRAEATSVPLMDYEALWFQKYLRDYASYDAEGVDADIARGYADYIDRQVREREQGAVTMYAHTEEAASLLLDSLYTVVPDVGCRDTVPMQMFRKVESKFAEMFTAFLDES